MKDLGIDLYIFIRFGDKGEMAEYTLASAGPCYIDPNRRKPIVGIVNIKIEM